MKANFLNRVLLLLGSFLFIFGPTYKGNLWFDTSLLVSLLIAILGIRHQPYLPGQLFKFCFPLFLLSAFVLVTNLFYLDVSYLQLVAVLIRPIKVFIVLLGSYHLFRFFRKYYGSNTLFAIMQYVYWCIAIHAGIMILQFLVPDFKEFIYNYTANGEYRSSFDYAVRMGGLSGGTGGAVLSVVMSIGIIIVPFIWDRGYKAFYLISSIAIFLSILICGRSGLWSAIIFTPVVLYFLSENKKAYFRKITIAVVAVVLVLGYLLTIISVNNVDDANIFAALGRTFDTFIEAKETNQFHDSTVDVLLSMILLPGNLVTTLIGNPLYAVEGNSLTRTLESDIGFIRAIWSYGLIGFILFLYPYLSLLVSSWLVRKRHKVILLLFFVLAVSLMFNFKENYLYSRLLFPITAIFINGFWFYKTNEKLS